MNITLDVDETTSTIEAILTAVNGRDPAITINALQFVLNVLGAKQYEQDQKRIQGIQRGV